MFFLPFPAFEKRTCFDAIVFCGTGGRGCSQAEKEGWVGEGGDVCVGWEDKVERTGNSVGTNSSDAAVSHVALMSAKVSKCGAHSQLRGTPAGGLVGDVARRLGCVRLCVCVRSPGGSDGTTVHKFRLRRDGAGGGGGDVRER